MELSDHFVEKWEKRFGRRPELENVIGIIRDSIWVSKCRDMVFAVSGKPFRTLGTYVNLAEKIIIKVDEINRVVVTVLTEGDEEYTREMERLYGPKICSGKF